jgi:shikimate dehydrogenase
LKASGKNLVNKKTKHQRFMKRYGLIGYPLTHSFSKRYFTEKFKKEGIDSTYQNFEIDGIDKFPEITRNNSEVIGLNVTIPYKEKVIPFLDELDDAAQEIGAVNTIRIKREGKNISLKGFNTDSAGFEVSIKPFLKIHHKKALILGTGGASKAVKYILKNLGIDYLLVTRKTPGKKEINYSSLSKEIIDEHTVIVNTTPLGTFPNTETYPDIPYKFLSDKHLLYDLVYNPEETQFLTKGKDMGATIKNGYEMLIQQAEEAYKIWNS